MTGKKLLLFTFLQWITLALLKTWFFNYQIFSEDGVQRIVFWIFTGVITTAFVRRFGVLSFLEVLFVIFVWILFNLLFDLLWLSPFIKQSLFGGDQYWIGVLFLGLSAFLFHKFRHIAIRHGHHKHH